MTIAPFLSAPEATGPAKQILGLYRIAYMAFAGQDLTPLLRALVARGEANPHDAAVLHDLATILEASHNPEPALNTLRAAVAMQKDFCSVHGDGSGPRILAFVTAGSFMANIPVDFLLNHSNSVLWLHYVDADTPDLANLPDHDIAILAIGEPERNAAVLARMEGLLPSLRGPVLNGAPQVIAALARDRLSQLISGSPSFRAPQNCRMPRAELQALASGQRAAGNAMPFEFPWVIRPAAGLGGSWLARVDTAAELAAYLAGQTATSFDLAPFIDYRGADGLYAKQRVIFIKGQPFASHMAISENWHINYATPGMYENATRRAMEARWMESFDDDFARRHAAAFAAINRVIGLDYFGIDCAELPDGRLLVFGVDVTMIVHDMDASLFPYKAAAMRKLFDAFVAMAASSRQLAQATAA